MCTRRNMGREISMRNVFSSQCFVERQGFGPGTLHYNSTVIQPGNGYVICQHNRETMPADAFGDGRVLNRPQRRGDRRRIDPDFYAVFFINNATVDGCWQGQIGRFNIRIKYQFRSETAALVVADINYQDTTYPVSYFQNKINVLIRSYCEDFLENNKNADKVALRNHLNDIDRLNATDTIRRTGLEITAVNEIKINENIANAIEGIAI